MELEEIETGYEHTIDYSRKLKMRENEALV